MLPADHYEEVLDDRNRNRDRTDRERERGGDRSRIDDRDSDRVEQRGGGRFNNEYRPNTNNQKSALNTVNSQEHGHGQINKNIPIHTDRFHINNNGNTSNNNGMASNNNNNNINSNNSSNNMSNNNSNNNSNSNSNSIGYNNVREIRANGTESNPISLITGNERLEDRWEREREREIVHAHTHVRAVDDVAAPMKALEESCTYTFSVLSCTFTTIKMNIMNHFFFINYKFLF